MADLSLQKFQHHIREMYLEKDIERGIDGTFMWLVEEIGELATALREGTKEELAAEFADVIAWLTTIANVAEIDLTQALLEKYGSGCPGCQQLVCDCSAKEKP
ncbi:MAG: nucleotide pyrophosphohydrolase [Pirellulaceae bacterium]|nr:nucleotide pyrophosphohydrolase [Pirellulaceae bacterium]